jgi:esterase/lipase superfamily enzyme
LTSVSERPAIFVWIGAIAFLRPLAILRVLIVAAPIVSCASRPESGFLSPVAGSVTGASDHTVLVATTRERDSRPGTYFNGERASSLDYATITVSVPPTHVPGQIELASTPPGDPSVNFVVRDAAYLDSDKAFVLALNAQLEMRPKASRNVFVFIHGFNTLFAEGLYRFTQVVQDSKAPGVPVLFTWASRGKIADYIYDNNSATAARDGLEHVLRLALASDADQVNILAHSMGNWVTVEALRQIKISGDLQHRNKIGHIFLAAPDIDIDVFKSQMRRFGKPSKPFYVILSKDDKALAASRFIAGGETRVGDDPNVAELAALGATVIDLSDVRGDDPTNHDKFAQLAEVAPQLLGVLAAGIGKHPGAGAESQEAVGSTLGSVVALPAALLGAPVKIIAGQ